MEVQGRVQFGARVTYWAEQGRPYPWEVGVQLLHLPGDLGQAALGFRIVLVPALSVTCADELGLDDFLDSLRTWILLTSVPWKRVEQLWGPSSECSRDVNLHIQRPTSPASTPPQPLSPTWSVVKARLALGL